MKNNYSRVSMLNTRILPKNVAMADMTFEGRKYSSML